MAPTIDEYRYPGPNDDCRAGKHVEYVVVHNDYGPQMGKCSECGVALCRSFLPAWPGEEWEGCLCTLPAGHGGDHENAHSGDAWPQGEEV